MDKKRRSSAVLLALALLATGFTAQAQTTYGPIRPGEDLWDIAKHIYPDQGVTADQVMLALLRANPQAFGYPCNANAPLHRGFVLQVPALAEVKVLGREDAQREFGRQLREWEDHRLTGKPFVCPPVGPPVSEVAPALSQAGAATPLPADAAAPAERPQGEAPTAPATPPATVPPERPQAEVPAALPATTPMHAEPSQAAVPTTPVGTTAVPSGQPATKAEGAQPPEGATPPPQWQRLWARITPYLGFGWFAIPIVVALIAGIVFWRYRRAPAKAPPAPVATSPQPTAPDLPPTDRA